MKPTKRHLKISFLEIQKIFRKMTMIDFVYSRAAGIDEKKDKTKDETKDIVQE